MKRLLLLVSSLILLQYGVAQTICQPFALKDVRLLPSRFQRNMQRDSAWIASIPVNSLLHSFRNTAGVFSSKEGGYMTMLHLSGWESLDCDLRGHTTGHLLSAMAYIQMREKGDSLVQGLAEVQRHYGSGYLSAFGEGLIDRNIQGKSVWAPFYTLHKILQGLLDQYTLCGNETALEVAKGMGNWAYNKLKPLNDDTRTRMLRNEFGGFNEAMYNLYALTRDERYLWVARFFYHNDKIDPLKALSSSAREEGGADLGTNHANTFIPKLLGECRNYELFGDAASRRAAERLFWTLAGDHAFVTGELSDKEHLFKPEEQSKHLTGYDGENCCTYNLLKLADRLFCYEPNSKIADYYERALYNHILGQQDTLTSMVCYFTPLMTGGYRLYSTRDSSFWCCVGSGFESHAKYQSSIYFHSHEALYVNLFIPSEVEWDGIVVRQETNFPESNKVKLTITSPSQPSHSSHSSPPPSPLFEREGPGVSPSLRLLKIRYPYWATFMKVNGRKMKPGKDGYVTIARATRSSSSAVQRLEVEFGMSLRHEPTKDDPTRVALMYGPIVLAGRLEAVAHPFSNPRQYNDYYTFDYGCHPDITLGEVRQLAPLHFQSEDISIEPLYNMQHCRYVVYWKKE